MPCCTSATPVGNGVIYGLKLDDKKYMLQITKIENKVYIELSGESGVWKFSTNE
jgi:hypothetical protein